ncbi:MAG: dihydrofolate reductase family protein [Bacteroidota bacterium]
MRKIILGVAVSLDGYIEGPQGEYDWCFTDQDYGMSDFMKRIDTIFFGRKSYEMMLRAGGDHTGGSAANPWAKMKNYVFSNTLKSAYKDTTLMSGDLKSQVDAMKSGEGKDIWLFGGASLTSSLLNAGLVDELWLAVHPILLGNGKLLFSGVQNRIKTRLKDVKSYSSGLVSLGYEIEKVVS